MTDRQSLTDSKNRALCLRYRDGHRCRRLATMIVVPPKHDGKVMCADCAKGLAILVVSKKGFTVSISGIGTGHETREYYPIK